MCNRSVSYALSHNSRALMLRCLLRRCNLDVGRKRTSTLSFQGPHPRRLRTPCRTSGTKMAGSATALVLCHLTSRNSQSSCHHMNPNRLLLRQTALLVTPLQIQKLPIACNHHIPQLQLLILRIQQQQQQQVCRLKAWEAQLTAYQTRLQTVSWMRHSPQQR